MDVLKLRRLRLLILIVAISFPACGDHGTDPEPSTVASFHDPWPDEEAENLALIMSSEISAPQDLYERVKADLATIRERWGEEFPALHAVSYQPFHKPGYLSLGIDRDTLAAIQEGLPVSWDTLNERLGLERIGLSKYSPSLSLNFRARLNPEHLVRLYKDIPWVRWIGTGIRVGDWSTIQGYVHPGGPTYLFRDASGDCPAGCAVSHYIYFRSTGTEPVLVGDYTRSNRPEEPPPDWWEEASQNVDAYFQPEIERMLMEINSSRPRRSRSSWSALSGGQMEIPCKPQQDRSTYPPAPTAAEFPAGRNGSSGSW